MFSVVVKKVLEVELLSSRCPISWMVSLSELALKHMVNVPSLLKELVMWLAQRSVEE